MQRNARRSAHRLAVLLAASLAGTGAVAAATALTAPAAKLTPAEGGQTVYDSTLNVTWLANGDYAATETFGVPDINADGSMNYRTAVKWVAAMNAADYLGHKDWTIPATPKSDASCAKTGPNDNSFGFKCKNSAMGSLYYVGLGLSEPNTAVPMPPTTAGAFKNFQPYLYWSGSQNGHVGTEGGANQNGFVSFSFNAGYKGGNVSPNFLYVLPMIEAGKLTATPIPAGMTVTDPKTKITWLANADLAATETFGVTGIDPDGAMAETTAVAWVKAMNAANGGKGYLGQTHWELPPTVDDDPGCTMKTFGFQCAASPLGELYYGLLGKHAGKAVVATPDSKVGPLHNIQPYLYWSCLGVSGQMTCSTTPAADNFEFSFSFGNGFQGTDVLENDLYVMVYYPGPPPAAH
jgi:hypothetical protein